MESKSNKLIIFDLDETLIHASDTELNYAHHFRVDTYFVYERPGVRTFLKNIDQHFAMGIRSSAGDDYVAEIVGHIVPETIEPAIIWDADNYLLTLKPVDNVRVIEKRGWRNFSL